MQKKEIGNDLETKSARLECAGFHLSNNLVQIYAFLLNPIVFIGFLYYTSKPLS